MIRVVVADDHPAVRMGTAHALERDGDIRVVGQAGGPYEVIECLGKVACDVLVTDFSMPDSRAGDGLVMLDRVTRAHPGLRILVVTALSHPPLLQAIAAGGCHGIVDKQAPLAEVAAAVRALAIDETWFRGEIEARIAEAEATRDAAPGSQLSPRELEVIRHFAEGMTVDDIAERLHRSNKTVSRQKVDAMRRLGLDNDDALILYARQHRLA